MTSTEIWVIVGGLMVGYWLVSKALGRTPASSTRSDRSDEPAGDDRRDEPGTEQPGNGHGVHDDHIPSSWFRILEVAESAKHDEIVAAYRRKIGEYHPDKVSQMGAEIRDVAERKSKQINAAYEYAMKLRG